MDLEETRKIKCRCGVLLGEVAMDSQVLIIGNVQSWMISRFTCNKCGAGFFWRPKKVPQLKTSEEVAIEKELRKQLGAKKKTAGRPPNVEDELD